MILIASIQSLIQAVQWSLPAAGDLFAAAFRASSQQAAAIVVTAVWQGALIAGVLAICLRMAPRTPAEHRFLIWAAAFVTLVSLPFLTLISRFPAAAVAGVAAATTQAAARPLLVRPLFSIDARWSLAIAALWAAATLFRASDLAVHSFRLLKLWKDAKPVDLDGHLTSMLSAAGSPGSHGPVQVCTTTTLQRPSVIGFFKPRILIPDWLFARLTKGELEQIVLHEAEHLRRHDDWTNLLQKLCLVLFPLNPALLWIERRLCREREMACDDGVIRITRAPRAYAACLASLAERGLQRRAEALSLGAWQRRPELVHRVHSILRRKHSLGPVGTRALMGALSCGLLLGSIELSRCPQLVAFVPAQIHDRVAFAANLTAPVSARIAPARVHNAAYLSVRNAGTDHPSTDTHATKIEASLRASSPAPLSDARASKEGSGIRQKSALFRETPSFQPNSQSPHPMFLNAELPSSQPLPDQEQQWIVLTTWEQVETTHQNAGLTADYETGANANASDVQSKNAGTAQPGQQTASQITVTRLILRIFPANSLSTQPALVPTRDGWLVLQL
jgi:beta-lactamase regulating signal transducer with metallopeptidase domain